MKTVSVRVNLAHDGLRRGAVVQLADTADLRRRIAKGYLSRTETTEWHKTAKESTSDPTELSPSLSMEPSELSGDPNSESTDTGPMPSES